jgi:hypothetical protein
MDMYGPFPDNPVGQEHAPGAVLYSHCRGKPNHYFSQAKGESKTTATSYQVLSFKIKENNQVPIKG